MFKIIKKDQTSWARAGQLETAHGTVLTPAYSIVGTHGSVQCLPSSFLPDSKTQLIISNTYHLWQSHQKNGGISQLPRVHDLLGKELPIITDSGGFQVFSLGFSREHAVGKVSDIFPKQQQEFKRQFAPGKNLVRITEGGAFFSTEENGEQFLGPALSIKIQEALGADITLAFDECTSPLHSYQYTKEALRRTHRWAAICLKAKTRSDQKLYGIVQGGEFRDLREESARFINSLPFDGVAIGGSLGQSKTDAWGVLDWTIPLLGETRPRHFLGMGQIEDLFEGVARGIDTFDCVIPTREARHARIWTVDGHFDVTKKIYQINTAPLEKGCACPTCQTISRRTLHQLFKDKDKKAGIFATMHNVFFFNQLMERIRQSILEEKFAELKKEWLAKTKKPLT